MQDYGFVPRWQFHDFAQLVEVQLRTISEELEAERRARMTLAAEFESL